jgi:hypothetical protein
MQAIQPAPSRKAGGKAAAAEADAAEPPAEPDEQSNAAAVAAEQHAARPPARARRGRRQLEQPEQAEKTSKCEGQCGLYFLMVIADAFLRWHAHLLTIIVWFLPLTTFLAWSMQMPLHRLLRQCLLMSAQKAASHSQHNQLTSRPQHRAQVMGYYLASLICGACWLRSSCN